MCKAANRIDFQEALSQVRLVDETTYKWMIKNESDQQFRFSCDTISKSDHITNNISETSNNRLREDKELPILSLLELYRKRIITRLQSRSKVASLQVTLLPLLMYAKLNMNIQAFRNVWIVHTSLIEFEVIDLVILPSKIYTLDLQKKNM